jgi:hypothetical protein
MLAKPHVQRSRRTFLEATAYLAAPGVGLRQPAAAWQGGAPHAGFSNLKALVFDVFGTVVD